MTRWVKEPERYAAAVKLFHALICAPGTFGQRLADAKRVSVQAHNLEEAKRLLESAHGVGTVYSLWVDSEWQVIRDK
jgi:hypothetical protein